MPSRLPVRRAVAPARAPAASTPPSPPPPPPPGHSPAASADTRIGDLAAMARILVKLNPSDEPVQRKRKLVAQFCRLLGEQVGATSGAPPVGEGLSPRVRETLVRLLAGDSEKQIALRMGVSPHTVHVYVKNLYRHYDVASRGELLARFVNPATTTATTPR